MPDVTTSTGVRHWQGLLLSDSHRLCHTTSCTYLLAHAKLKGVQRGFLLEQDAVTGSCACERGYLWDVNLTACPLLKEACRTRLTNESIL